ncbi:MAG: hypothetical protein WBC91_08890 [Phototrophicaceae bacterium]
MKKLIRHNLLPNRVHEFVFLTDERQAIDLYFDMVGGLFECSPKDRPICYIINWSQSGVPSLNYMFLKTKEWGRKRREVAAGRCLILFDQKGFLPIGKALAMLVEKEWGPKIQIRLEHNDKRDEGMNWLTQNKDFEQASV